MYQYTGELIKLELGRYIQREKYCAETIPQLLVNAKTNGVWGGDMNCIIDRNDCTTNPESRKSPSLVRLVRSFSLCDSYRHIHPDSKVFSRFYTTADGNVQGARLDRSYHWGSFKVLEAEYQSVAFSDHLSLIVKLSLPDLEKILSPHSRPLFKTSPEVVMDKVFKERLNNEMQDWLKVKERGLAILPWWDMVIKPGIRQLALARSKELNKSKRSRLNCLLMKQSYFIKELQSGHTNTMMFRRLKEVKAEICDWFETESKKVILQTRADDVQQSEKVQIYHHEQHKKQVKRSAILKLDTGSRIIAGHEEVSAYLESQVADLLLNPAVLDPVAQAALLDEVSEVFTEKDSENLIKLPDKEEVKS